MTKSNINIDNLAKDLFLFTSRPNSVQRACLFCLNFQKNPYQSIRKVVSLPISETDDEWYFSREDFDVLAEKEAREFLSPNFIIEYISRGETYLQSWLLICKKVEDVFTKDTDNKIRTQVLRKYFSYPGIDESYISFGLSVWSFDQKVIPVYIEKLKNYFKEDYIKAWEVITSQTEFTEEQQMRIAISNLKSKFGNDIHTDILTELKKKYRYLGIYAPEDAGFTFETIQKIYSEISVDEASKIEGHIHHNKIAYDDLKRSIKDESIIQLIDQINYNVYFRTIRSEKISQGLAMVSPMYDYLINKFGYTRKQVGNLMNKEIVEYFDSGKIPPKRDSRLAMYFEDGEPFILDRNQTEEFRLKFELKDKVSTFSGSVAYKGIVSGRAKVITSANDLPKVKIGDILVSQFTRPEYMAAMQRAAAFITNDGGITCHAAIVARELKKPCIVGTKIATKVLKDGDMIEVDANAGMVKILK